MVPTITMSHILAAVFVVLVSMEAALVMGKAMERGKGTGMRMAMGMGMAAKRVSKWDDKVDALIVKWDDKVVAIPIDGDAEWRTNGEDREVIIQGTDDTNYVRVTVAGLVEMDIRVRPSGEKENKVHNYQIPADDTFAHLETQFRFTNLSHLVEGVLSKTSTNLHPSFLLFARFAGSTNSMRLQLLEELLSTYTDQE